MMGVPIKKMKVTDEEAKNIIKASLGNKLIGNITPVGFSSDMSKPIHSKFDIVWKFIGDEKDE